MALPQTFQESRGYSGQGEFVSSAPKQCPSRTPLSRALGPQALRAWVPPAGRGHGLAQFAQATESLHRPVSGSGASDVRSEVSPSPI